MTELLARRAVVPLDFITLALSKALRCMMPKAILPSFRLPGALALMVSTLVAHSSAYAADASVTNAAKPAPIQLMILGSYYMDSPGLDQVNVEVDEVAQPKRQREIAALVEQLARFAPTKVAVEMEPKPDTFAIAAYEKYTHVDSLIDRNEITQIGFRLAHRMKHGAVFAIDEQSNTVDYFPFDRVKAYAKEKRAGHGSSVVLHSVCYLSAS